MASTSFHLESTQARGRLSPVKTAQVLLLQRAQGLFSDPRNAAVFYYAGRIQRGETIVRVAGWGEVGMGGWRGVDHTRFAVFVLKESWGISLAFSFY